MLFPYFFHALLHAPSSLPPYGTNIFHPLEKGLKPLVSALKKPSFFDKNMFHFKGFTNVLANVNKLGYNVEVTAAEEQEGFSTNTTQSMLVIAQR